MGLSINREKVIKGLECCLGSNNCDIEPEEDCPYKGMCLCAMTLRLEVLALLKEQETKTGYWIDSAGCDKCSICGAEYSDLYPDYSNTHFCPNCGAKMESEIERR